MKNNTCLNGLVPKRVIDQVPKRVNGLLPAVVGIARY